ncbi:MAG: glutamate-5-semialdehyde dehydrogenase [Spirochaetaceae bacterium]|jgi:glutamate-5-semialdehyde dehydrogenase|nr:glutamate-5-semialdehyde dehydrogenase [Spirochaetaceae bacterium]
MEKTLEKTLKELKEAQGRLAGAPGDAKNVALQGVMNAIDGARKEIIGANEADVAKARQKGMKDALIDRLFLNDQRISSIIAGIHAIIQQEDPIGRVKSAKTLPNGLFIEEITVPLGVAAVIYESRPNVTADVFSLAYKAGCAILLRGSSSALDSNRALVRAIKQGLKAGGGLPEAVALADSGNRAEIDEILRARGWIDVVLPRGGPDLIRRVVEEARIPVIETGAGNCHIYVDASAKDAEAMDIIENAKIQKPGACNAVETLLVHRDRISSLMPRLAERFAGRVELRCDLRSKQGIGAIPETLVVQDARESDWETEFLDYILAVKTVDSLEEGIEHINRYGTKHSEAILTEDNASAEAFCRQVDAACVYINGSTRFTDGGEFGLGAELGISTQKFHARGPMGVGALTSIKYRITGHGQIRG